MVKCMKMKKCRRFEEVAVMEVKQVVGKRTRARSQAEVKCTKSRKRKAVGSEDGEMKKGYLQLRSRSLVMKHRNQSKLMRASVCGSSNNYTADGERIISRCSSMSSCEAVEEDAGILSPSVGVHTPCEDVGSSVCEFENSGDRREISLWSNQNVYSGEMESSAERKSRQSAPGFRAPSAAEIEEFFTAAEKSEKRRFASRYNFDVDKEVPLEGRYEWVRINQ